MTEEERLAMARAEGEKWLRSRAAARQGQVDRLARIARRRRIQGKPGGSPAVPGGK